MDIDAHDKHIRALLADNIELKAFKAWAEPILLAIEQGAAVAAEELEEADPTPVNDTTLVNEKQPPVEATSKQPAEEVPAEAEPTPAETEQAPIETEAAPVPVEDVPVDLPPVAEEAVSAPHPEELPPAA